MAVAQVNADQVLVQRLASRHWEGVLQALVVEHEAETGSRHAASLLAHWAREKRHFWQVCPKEIIDRLSHPLSDSPATEFAQRA